ncbi:UDP-4-amino-4,6-dideoxy-N-acetyl-beta-L-altrosamine N-acetyltransferase [Desulfofundulus thermobenzoicus]|uniref:UDP-4-amino-4, 6-dideoxy-N-acetyl-beta-L-altrosamine N-acetyltransferase n=1 Tax=Desulfofundulus thermobenzoicus TaxID=29376 RepID=A0A6N7INC5_9FIRM|nr:UDP-4-amino-4,6-dideoxy-N-acetyl-beta-L-altrosamine N-acetyltransferase [Desulfofundulus thermobenzoicus]MQL51451.1 UDP-4-amino-4,6-dideoxy-N-acetyl-beta-L-altrosamine N-acetyltransferase [Desulfofundulus thermobenzoicus]
MNDIVNNNNNKPLSLVRLQTITENDLELIRKWRNQDEIRNFMYTNHIISPEEHRKWYEKISNDPSVKYWIFSNDGKMKNGLVCLYNIDAKNKSAFWGFYVGDLQTKGKGIGSRVEFTILDHVFLVMDLNKLNCEVLSFNEVALNLHKKFGFEEEGYFKKHIFRDNKYFDVIRLAMLKEDWLNIHRGRMLKLIAK